MRAVTSVDMFLDFDSDVLREAGVLCEPRSQWTGSVPEDGRGWPGESSSEILRIDKLIHVVSCMLAHAIELAQCGNVIQVVSARTDVGPQ